MIAIIKGCAFYATAALALAMPAFACDDVINHPVTEVCYDEPGSVIVFARFSQGSVIVDTGTPSQFTAAKTVIEVGIVCPTGVLCADDTVRIKFHWVCPPVSGTVCRQNDFVIVGTVGQKITFNPSDIPNPPAPFGAINGNTVVPIAPCPRGFLIGYVIDNFDRPIKFDALIGDAVQRSFGTDLQSDTAFGIEADPALANGDLITLVNGGLAFDGGAGHYRMATGQLSADVRYDQDVVPPPGQLPYGDGFLILLTLDLRSNLSNPVTAVALDFYNETSESPLSTATSFICWEEVQLSSIDPNLTVANMGWIKGLVVSGQAINADSGVQVTLLGLFQATEGPAPGPANATRSYTVQCSNNSVPIPTILFPMF